VLAILAGALAPACVSESTTELGTRERAVGHGAGLPARTVWDWNGVVGTGQSLAVGGWGDLSQGKDLYVVSRTQPYDNLKLHDSTPFEPDAGRSPYSLDGGGTYSVVPLTEPIRDLEVDGVPKDFQYPGNILGETPQSGMANQLTFMALRRGEPGLTSLHSAVGWWGHDMSGIDKEGTGKAYPASLMEARQFKRLADEAGMSFGYQAVVLTHGESDSTNVGFEGDLEQMWVDYNEDLSAITGQTQRIPLLVSQQASGPFFGGPPLSSLAMWRAGLDHPGDIVCVGPKYQYVYVDGTHMNAPSYRRLGEKYAEVLDALNHGVAWQPLEPTSASLEGNVIRVVFHVPTPPLGWDTTLELPHTSAPSKGIIDNRQWASGRGFEVANTAGNLTITNVSISGDSVLIELPGAPSRDGLTVRYAVTQDAQVQSAGSGTGRLGQLRDSNDVVGYDAVDVDVNVTSGSSILTAVVPGSFMGRSVREIVTNPALPENTIIVARPDEGTIVLSSAWPDASGRATVKLHDSLHNYAVQFERLVE